MKGFDEKKFDTRLVEKHMENGTINRKELNEHLHKLADLAEEAEWVNYDKEPAEAEEPSEA